MFLCMKFDSVMKYAAGRQTYMLLGTEHSRRFISKQSCHAIDQIYMNQMMCLFHMDVKDQQAVPQLKDETRLLGVYTICHVPAKRVQG